MSIYEVEKQSTLTLVIIDTLKRLQAMILQVRPDMDIGNVHLLHDNARPQQTLEQGRQSPRMGGQLYHILHTRLIWLPLTITFSAP
ncbi:hypothetical protein ElyMa_004756500 [Elysia marginata]|uniref:Uncharacterized protein n=1 Tax=Elysia marginata TaxID=1093978 RepID=A0AAV4IFY4_9GAST|nr:hypothetical protein ElyMa_004756500 [Elysia marginata]